MVFCYSSSNELMYYISTERTHSVLFNDDIAPAIWTYPNLSSSLLIEFQLSGLLKLRAMLL